MKKRQRVAIVGVGSVGGVFASELLLADRHDVLLCARRPFTGLFVESSQLPAEHPDAVALTQPDDVGGPVDWVLLVTKAHQTEGAKPWLDALCTPSTRVVLIQNGIEQAERGRAIVPDATCIGSVVYCGASVIEPGRIAHTARCHLFVAGGPDGEALAELFEGTRATISAGDDYRLRNFEKLLINLLLNGPCAIANQPGVIYQQPAMKAMAADVISEVIQLASAEGVDMGADALERTLTRLDSLPATLVPSTLQDRRAGRAFEHDAITGAALRLASKHGISTPAVRAMHAYLCAIDPGIVD
ncbi:MAG: 2-dehydropantoate 2-reductase [Acidimicrobiales bacterium]|jgi:2-dehydropantoate 2-reductase